MSGIRREFALTIVIVFVFSSQFVQSNAQPVENGKNSTSTSGGKATNTSSTSSASLGVAEDISIYIFSNFFGLPWPLKVSNCTNVPAFFYKKTSSIDTHDNCVILFSRENCEGRHVKIAPGTSGHSHLSAVDFDDTLVSLKPCGDSKTATSSKAEPHKRVRRNSQILNFLMQNLGMGRSGAGDAQLDNNSGNGLQSFFAKLNLNSLMSQFQQQDDKDDDDVDDNNSSA